MSLSRGVQQGSFWLGLGQMFAKGMSQQEDAARKTGVLEREKRAKVTAMEMVNNPNSYTPPKNMSRDELFDATVHAAALTAAKQRNEIGATKLRVQKRFDNYEAMRADAQVMNNLLANGDIRAASYKAKDAFESIDDGWTADIHESEAANAPHTFTLTNQHTGETKTFPINKEYIKEAASYINRYRDSPQEADSMARSVQAYRRKQNLENMKNAEEMYSKDGNKFLGYTFSKFKKDKDGILVTGDQERVFLNPNMQPINEAVLPEYTTKQRAQNRADISASQAKEEKSSRLIAGAGRVMPGSGQRLEDGSIAGKDTLGLPATAPADQAGGLVLKGKEKEGEAKIPVKTTGGKVEHKTPDQLYKRIKMNQSALEGAKDSSGGVMVFPKVENFNAASPEEKETELARYERLSRDTRNQTEKVRSAAKQVLHDLQALGAISTDDWGGEKTLKGKVVGGASPLEVLKRRYMSKGSDEKEAVILP